MIRQVRQGKSVTVSYPGEPVAKISPIRRHRRPTLERRLRDLEQRGVLVRSRESPALGPVERRPGALARFLAERHG